MTESEWLTSGKPQAMLDFLLHTPGLKASDRKLRQFACTCALCRGPGLHCRGCFVVDHLTGRE
jgi:hypothetical protein